MLTATILQSNLGNVQEGSGKEAQKTRAVINAMDVDPTTTFFVIFPRKMRLGVATVVEAVTVVAIEGGVQF